jgi:pyridoxine 5-phosphate synthase|tara:strand:+ start:1452 stop:2264 length:813 start_codon:yes stop_codon:yes gene_type:complete
VFHQLNLTIEDEVGKPLDFAYRSDVLKLGVNIDHVATLREARYRGMKNGEPSPLDAALSCESAGAHGITAHLREDRRHILDADVKSLRKLVSTRLNLEMAIVPKIVQFALKLKPDIVCFVPENREEITTEGGLDVAGQLRAIKRVCKRMDKAGIEVSLFINPDAKQVDAAAMSGAQFIELHTGQYAEHFSNAKKRKRELNRLIAAAEHAHRLGLRVNAGHGLNYDNLVDLLKVPHLEELNVGHCIISRSLNVGLPQAVKEMLQLMKNYRE